MAEIMSAAEYQLLKKKIGNTSSIMLVDIIRVLLSHVISN